MLRRACWIWKGFFRSALCCMDEVYFVACPVGLLFGVTHCTRCQSFMLTARVGFLAGVCLPVCNDIESSLPLRAPIRMSKDPSRFEKFAALLNCQWQPAGPSHSWRYFRPHWKRPSLIYLRTTCEAFGRPRGSNSQNCTAMFSRPRGWTQDPRPLLL